MKITKSRLKQIIKEELENVLVEQPHFAKDTGHPITDKGRQMEKDMVDKAIAAENKCVKWALEDAAMKEEWLKYHRSGGKGLPDEMLEKCPFKADKESHRRLEVARARADRAAKGLAPADDDTSAIAKVRRRTHRAKQGLPPADDDTSAIAKVRRAAQAKKEKA